MEVFTDGISWDEMLGTGIKPIVDVLVPLRFHAIRSLLLVTHWKVALSFRETLTGDGPEIISTEGAPAYIGILS